MKRLFKSIMQSIHYFTATWSREHAQHRTKQETHAKLARELNIEWPRNG